VGGTCSICPETPTKIEISPGGYCSNWKILWQMYRKW
jgi:hypothetical protein